MVLVVFVWQYTRSASWSTAPGGFTVMVNVLGVPAQVIPALVYKGVTVMVATCGDVPVFAVTNDAIFPVPLAAKPIEVLLFTQLYVVAGTVVLKLTGAVLWPAHNSWLPTKFTLGVGFTVMVNIIGVPVQLIPLVKTGVTVIVATCGVVPKLVALNDGILPLPFGPSPIDVLLFVQLYVIVPPVLGLLNIMGVVIVWLHSAMSGLSSTTGLGFTVMVNDIVVPIQPEGDVGVTVIVAVCTFKPPKAINDGMFPLPLAAKPIDVLLFTQL